MHSGFCNKIEFHSNYHMLILNDQAPLFHYDHKFCIRNPDVNMKLMHNKKQFYIFLYNDNYITINIRLNKKTKQQNNTLPYIKADFGLRIFTCVSKFLTIVGEIILTRSQQS